MSKFVNVWYYPYFFDNRNKSIALYGNGHANKPFRVTLNIGSIVSIQHQSRTLRTYDSYEERNSCVSMNQYVYLLETNSADPEFRTYWVTPESHICLMQALDPIIT